MKLTLAAFAWTVCVGIILYLKVTVMLPWPWIIITAPIWLPLSCLMWVAAICLNLKVSQRILDNL